MQRLEPRRALEAAPAIVFLLLLAGFAVAGAAGGFAWQGLLSALAALVIVGSGLLYAWRLGAAGRRE